MLMFFFCHQLTVRTNLETQVHIYARAGQLIDQCLTRFSFSTPKVNKKSECVTAVCCVLVGGDHCFFFLFFVTKIPHTSGTFVVRK